MNINTVRWSLRLAKATVLCVLAILTAGCGSMLRVVPDHGVAVDTVSSHVGRLSSVHLWYEGEDVVLRGKVTGYPLSRGHVRGHVRVELFTPDGELSRAACVEQRSAGPRKFYERFRWPLDVEGSTIRVTHDPEKRCSHPTDDAMSGRVHSTVTWIATGIVRRLDIARDHQIYRLQHSRG